MRPELFKGVLDGIWRCNTLNMIAKSVKGDYDRQCTGDVRVSEFCYSCPLYLGKEETGNIKKYELGDSCREAISLITGSRQAQYGDQNKNFTMIAEIASLLIGKELTKYDVLKVHWATKLMRETHKHKSDNLVDLCGYVDIYNTLKEQENVE